MNNVILKSLFYIVITTFILSSIIFFNNGIYSFKIYSLTFIYTIRELIPVSILFSQMLFVMNTKDLSASKAILFSILPWLIFLLIIRNINEINYTTLGINNKNELFVDRGITKNYLNIFFFAPVKEIIKEIKKWSIIEFKEASSLLLLLTHISLQLFLERFFSKNSILKVLIFILYILFGLYVWTYQLNIPLIFLCFALLKLKKRKIHEDS